MPVYWLPVLLPACLLACLPACLLLWLSIHGYTAVNFSPTTNATEKAPSMALQEQFVHSQILILMLSNFFVQKQDLMYEKNQI